MKGSSILGCFMVMMVSACVTYTLGMTLLGPCSIGYANLPSDLYATLNLDRDASYSEIASTYHALTRRANDHAWWTSVAHLGRSVAQVQTSYKLAHDILTGTRQYFSLS